MGRWDRSTRESRDRRDRSPDYKRRRSRSKSPSSRSKRRSPDRGPYYRRERDRDRDRESSKRNRSRSRERSEKDSRAPKVEDIVGGEVNYENFDKDEQQKKLEILMQQRRERVEKWRSEQAKKKTELGEDNDSTNKDNSNSDKNENEESMGNEGTMNEDETNKKKWTLDDDGFDEDDDDYEENEPMEDVDDGRELQLPKKKDDDEEEEMKLTETKNIKLPSIKTKINSNIKNSEKNNDINEEEQSKSIVEKETITLPEKNGSKPVEKVKDEKKKEETIKEEKIDVDEDIDPLDAFMMGIQEQVKKLRGRTLDTKDNHDKKVSLIVGVAKKQEIIKDKGELIEQNQDALEYSSEDELTTADDLSTMNSNLIANQANKTKKLITITKEDITYLPFRKNFYIEVPELAKMSQEEVDAYRNELEHIQVKGKGCPKPIKTWAQSGVSKKVMELLKRNNFLQPTPIQAQAIPAIMSGRDIIGIAKTGSGKTLAFVLPMIRHILDQDPLEPGDGPIAVIMTPTRELATQIWSECRKFTRYLGLRVVAVYGGTSISEQIGELKPGAEIIVCTPGRMIDMLAANSGRVTNLRRCTYVVLDEADRMFDMGFEPQVMRIIDAIRPDRQTVMFSATFPRIMEALARRILTRPIEIQVGGRSVVCKEVQQNVVVIDEENKFLKLLELLGRYLVDNKSAIVFVDKQEAADMLLKELMHASYTCLALHGGIDQTDRDSTISDFKNGRVKVLIATSVAARGLDVKHCILVVNYDCPNHYEDYVHRCGRTGRANNIGYAWTFITQDQGKYACDIIKAFELSDLKIPDDLKIVWLEFKHKSEAEGKKVKNSSGFAGKGFKFDEAEAQLPNEKKKFQKAALGLQDSDDEDPEDDIDQEIENMLAPKKSVKQVSLSAATSAAVAAANTTAASLIASNPLLASAANQNVSTKLELAKRLASKINGNLSMTNITKPTSSTEAFLKGETFNITASPAAFNAKSLAEQRAEKLHAKLNYIPKDIDYSDDYGRLGEESSPNIPVNIADTFQRYEEELEINEFPQQARWRVTSKEALASISEYSEAGITVRGTYFPPGKEAKEGERKLYLAIEGISERSVSKAKAEIIRLIKEELVKLQNTYQPINKARYKVV